MELKAPFPWFGGKSRAADLIWSRLGDVQNYVEPFAGSLAVLLGRPHARGIETVCDLDGFICNFWRALAHDPDAVAAHADWPVNENDLHARHVWLRARRDELSRRLEGDPDFHDAKIAGWWVWGMACWIGGGFCGESSAGPWGVVDGKFIHLGGAGRGVIRQRVQLGNAGQGVQRSLVHLGDGHVVQRTDLDALREWFRALAARLRRVRVCSGDWSRVMGPSVTHTSDSRPNTICGIVLDPPYGDAARRDMNLYSRDSGTVAADVRAWAVANGDNPQLRIALCGYEGEHEMPGSWECVPWKAGGGYATLGNGAGKLNRHRERIWFSPACLGAAQPRLVEVG